MKLPPKFRNAVNRRHFLSFLGTATIALLGLPKRLRAAPSDQWDLIVVGGGNAGLPAAIFAAQRGARVLTRALNRPSRHQQRNYRAAGVPTHKKSSRFRKNPRAKILPCVYLVS